ncbi:MAG: hypothetical protein ACK5YR_08225 [Pirellula sp.]
MSSARVSAINDGTKWVMNGGGATFILGTRLSIHQLLTEAKQLRQRLQQEFREQQTTDLTDRE